MGLFWDLIQQSEIEKQKSKAESLEDRVSDLEKELEKTKALLLRVRSKCPWGYLPFVGIW